MRGSWGAGHRTGVAYRPTASYSVRCAQDEAGDVEFEQDPKKAEPNRRKHGVESVDIVIVFDDDRAVTLVDDHPREDRYVTFGMDAQGRVLAVS